MMRVHSKSFALIPSQLRTRCVTLLENENNRTFMSILRTSILRALYGAAAVSIASAHVPAFAQQANEQKGEPVVTERVNVVGTRRTASSATDTALPIDVVPLSKISETAGQFDLAQTLQNLSPSFNSTRQTGADGADLVDSAALRGLGSDQTLVLLNGKRHHTVALVNLFGARNRGNTGTDFNTIPMLAVESINVLRDGAAAQYGSDAIAGVIDIALKRRAGCEGVLGFGQYSEGDGKNFLASAYCGFKIADTGVFSLTGEFNDRGRSNRAEADNPRIIGDSKIRNGTLLMNGELPTGAGSKAYLTLKNQQRDASSGAFARGGIGSDDIPSRNSEAMYPNGFVPFINADLEDTFAILGHKWQLGDWNMDLSQTYGRNAMKYNISNTLNASIANQDVLNGGRGISPTRFDAGGFSFQQMTTNLDFSKFYGNVAGGMNVAFGAEYRREKYKIGAGEAGSYIDADGVGEGGNAGSQGFPGFQPADNTNKSRNSVAAYIDIETDLSKSFKLQTALRGERYNDFGSTLTGKVAGSLKLSNEALVRGSFSTGFRAPSLQQVFFSSTITDFISGVPVDVVIAPIGGRVANAVGLPKLKEEQSTSFTFGATFNPSKNTAITADFYNIDIKDRIVLSGRFDNSFPGLGSILDGLGVGQAQFFVNSVKTRTTGFDLTASHKTKLGAASLNTFLALNLSKTEVKKINTPPSLVGSENILLSERERLFIEQGAPRRKATLGFEYATGSWTTDLKVIHFGPQTLGTFSGTENGVPNAVYKAKTSADLSVTYAYDAKTKITVGGNNIFNVKPTAQDANETDNGFKYDSVQFGLNGASYFIRLWKSF
jgi:iron complex outermembrane recepter protein